MGNKGVYGNTPEIIQPNNSKIKNIERTVNEQNKILKEQNEKINEIIKRIEIMEAHPDAKAAIEKNPMDLNGDGVVDKKDSSIAGKVLVNSRNKNR